MGEDVPEVGLLLAPEVEHDCPDHHDGVGEEHGYNCMRGRVPLEKVEARKMCQTVLDFNQSFMF